MTNEYNFYIRTPEDLVNAINIVGFLPLFANDIPGFSAEERHAPVVSLQLKELGDYRKGGVKGFETTISRLQAQCYVTVSDFTYRTNRRGERTGWGLAEYSTPEKQLGADFCDRVYEREPEESRERLLTHLRWLLPDVSEERRRKLLG